jgi:hypothetical protein
MSDAVKAALREAGRCYVCGNRIGIYTWTDPNGQAHSWCISSERPKWESAAAVARAAEEAGE